MSRRDTSSKTTTADEPLDVRLTVKVNFGDSKEDAITVMDDQHIPMVGSVFDYRDKVVRFFTVTLFRVAMTNPNVAREFVPGMIYLMQKAGAILPGRD